MRIAIFGKNCKKEDLCYIEDLLSQISLRSDKLIIAHSTHLANIYQKIFTSTTLYNFQQRIIILIHLQRKTNNYESKNAKELDAM